MPISTRVVPFLSFPTQAEEAARLYTSVVPDSRLGRIVRNPATGAAMVVEFELGGLPMRALNTGRDWKFTEAFSLSVECDDQAQLDTLWEALLADGGRPLHCGWLFDRFGVAWQVVPRGIDKWLGDPDGARAGRVMAVLLTMQKLDIEQLRAAHEGR